MADITLKRNDLDPIVLGTAKDANGDVVDLSNYDTIRFIMKLDVADKDGQAAKVDTETGAVFTTDGTDGKVQYSWVAADVDTIGDYLAEFQLSGGTGRKRSLPTKGYITIQIIEDLDQA